MSAGAFGRFQASENHGGYGDFVKLGREWKLGAPASKADLLLMGVTAHARIAPRMRP
jgi:hypothetical protein